MSAAWPRLYHGSDEPLEELEGNYPGGGGSLGYGLYLTTDPDFAETFGRYIHEVESPVPDELVAEIEIKAYECGDSMATYTPGSVPFSFALRDRVGGKMHLYSVLGNCEETVRSYLRVRAIAGWKPPIELKKRLDRMKVSRAWKSGKSPAFALWDSAVRSLTDPRSSVYGGRIDDAVERAIDASDEDDVHDGDGKALLVAAEACAAYCEAELESELGVELDMDELSSICQEHGYSAFYISGYARGDEYVIFDDGYLPVKVSFVREVPRSYR